MSVTVKYRQGKNEKVGHDKQMDIDDLDDIGVDTIELRWTRTRKVRIREQIVGFQDYAFARNRHGDTIARKNINDAPITFYPDDRYVGYAYVPKTKRNMHFLAGIQKNKVCKVTDRDIQKELDEIIEKMHYVKVMDLHDHSMDAILKHNNSHDELTLEKNANLKEQLKVLEAVEENELLERKIADLQNKGKTPIVEVKKSVLISISDDPVPTAKDTEIDPEVEYIMIEGQRFRADELTDKVTTADVDAKIILPKTPSERAEAEKPVKKSKPSHVIDVSRMNNKKQSE